MTMTTEMLLLAGRVHTALRPLPGTTLTLVDRAGVQLGRACTGSGGEFQIIGLTAGSYVLIFSRAGYQPKAEVVMLGAGTQPLDVMLEPAVSVHGVVHDRDSGRPVGAAIVTAVDPGGEVIASTVSDPDGSYHITGVDADAITLVVAAPGADPTATVVELGRGTDYQANLALDTYSTVSGKVTVAGQPVDRLPLALHAPDGWTVATTITDDHGTYRFDRVKAGQYVLSSVTSASRTIALSPDATTADLDLSVRGA
jgi:Carboxypeptidase regulatory-like domain